MALAGGVGGAKLAQGLYSILPPDTLSVIVNTGDDFDLYGLRICPDADTVMYTLAGLANSQTGWGVADDTFAALDMLRRYEEETWFLVGDRDLATHLTRTRMLRAGRRFTEVEGALARALGIRAALLPMADELVTTRVLTPAGELPFQDYFVRRRHADPVLGVRFEGIEVSRVSPEVRAAVLAADAIIFCPSNPFVSIGPVLAVPGMRELLSAVHAPLVAVSPIVGGRALKGPADRMLAGMDMPVAARGVAQLYAGLVDGIVIDTVDASEREEIEQLGMRVLVTQTVMGDESDRRRLGREVHSFATRLREERA